MAIIVAVVVVWELASASGLFYRDVVPSLLAIGRALLAVVANPEFYGHLGVTLLEVAGALAIGGALGLLVGLALGGSRFLADAFEHYLYYLGPTPKIIFFPIMIMWFGVGPASKVAMGSPVLLLPHRAQRRQRHAPDRSGADPRRAAASRSAAGRPPPRSTCRPCARRS